MSRGQRLTFLGIAAVIAVVAVILLAGGGDETDEPSTPRPRPRRPRPRDGGRRRRGDRHRRPPTPKPKPKPPPLLQAGKEQALNYKEGETVRFRVVNDEAEEVHVHGYDITKELEPGKVETVSFKADITGIFEIELEGSGAAARAAEGRAVTRRRWLRSRSAG